MTENKDWKMDTAVGLAQAFDHWYQLDKAAVADPTRVRIEDLAMAWRQLEEAYERWNLSQ